MHIGRRLTGLALAVWLGLGAPAGAGDLVYASPEGLAIKGYDPVAYFTRATPMAGRPDITLDWRGATWRFISAAHRDRFAADPEAYAPQFGGWCVWGLANSGARIPSDPEIYEVVDDRLYLNLSPTIQRKWSADRPHNLDAAMAAWERLTGGDPAEPGS